MPPDELANISYIIGLLLQILIMLETNRPTSSVLVLVTGTQSTVAALNAYPIEHNCLHSSSGKQVALSTDFGVTWAPHSGAADNVNGEKYRDLM